VIGLSLSSGSRNIKPAGAADFVDPQKVVEQALGDFLGIATIPEHAIGVADSNNGQTTRLILGPDRRLQGIWNVIVPVPSDQHELLALAGSPNQIIRRIEWQPQGLEAYHALLEGRPKVAPGVGGPNRQNDPLLLSDVNVRENPLHPRPLNFLIGGSPRVLLVRSRGTCPA
jgi:hypothetical protein